MPSSARKKSLLAEDKSTSRTLSGRKKSAALNEHEIQHKHDDLLSDSLAYAIKRAQVRCDEALTRHLDPGLSPARFAALCAVGSNPGISQAALGGLLGIAGPSVVKVVDELEKMNLVKRASSTDRRVYALHLTEHGDADLDRYERSFRTFEKKASANLSAEERKKLLEMLSKVATSSK